MKKIFLLLLLVTITAKAQDFGQFSGGFVSNGQLYQDDTKTHSIAPQDKFRANSYFTLGYNYKAFTLGLQYESYQPNPLLGYSPSLKGEGIATYFFNYKAHDLDITAGYFYEQYGSGMILRSWEDKQLGMNNALKGVRIKFEATNYLNLSAFYGKQRDGFELSEGTLQGANIDFNLAKLTKLDGGLNLGLSYVGRYEPHANPNPDFPDVVNAISARLDFDKGAFNGKFEFVTKGEDARVVSNTIFNNKFYKGKGLLLEVGYSKRRYGLTATFRRVENLSMYTDRIAYGNTYNSYAVNNVLALTRQHDFSLPNIYTYQAQAGLSFESKKAGEVGFQLDGYYNLSRGSVLGGEYGTNIAINYSQWSGLKTTFDIPNDSYTTDGFAAGEKYFSDFNIEIDRKISKKIRASLGYVNLFYNILELEGHGTTVNASIITSEVNLKLNKKKSARIEVQHLSTKDDKKNWMAGTVEYNFNRKFGIYLNDMYNYGNDDTDKQIHYYSVGAVYSKSATRFSLGYGRQRGGLLCVGGVCRYVPENTGLSMSITTTF
jgi:hypothetical protein